MTNYNLLDENYIEEKKEINLLLNNESKAKKIDLNIKRMISFNKECDTTHKRIERRR